jgi:hypothetical protein
MASRRKQSSMSVIRPATLKALIESKLEMKKLELKKDFLEFAKYLEEMAIIHDEHCHVVEHKKTGDSGMRNNGKGNDAGSRSSEHNTGGSSHGGASNKASDRDRTKSGHGSSSESTGTGKQSAREPPLASTRRSVREKSTTCLTVHTLARTKLWSCCPSTRKREMPTRRRRTLRLWAITERRRKIEMDRPRISRQMISESGSRY